MRNTILILLLALMAALPAFSQASIDSVSVYKGPAGLNFLDGQAFSARGNCLWRAGAVEVAAGGERFAPLLPDTRIRPWAWMQSDSAFRRLSGLVWQVVGCSYR